jgi:hypothetical protein
MGEAPDIFRKRRLTPGQLRSVAEYRLQDALCLLSSGDPARANGAMYMGGFVIECLLKALLLERHPNLQTVLDPATLSASDGRVYRLLYSHELDAMLAYLPELEKKLKDMEGIGRRSIWHSLRTLCEQWTVYARYSTKQAKRPEAERFVGAVQEVKRWLKEL